MNAVDLTKKLIFIPSYVDNSTNEREIAEYVYQYLSNISWLTTVKQNVENNRFNVIAYSSLSPKLLLVGHLDTVQPSANWQTSPTQPIQKNNTIIGLGSSDMKSGLAAILSSLPKKKPATELMILFYVDEEYDFAGMQRFTQEYQDKIQPQLIVSADGDGCAFGYACRGLIEFSAIIKGKSGHAANPDSGINAITNTTTAIKQLTRKIKTYSSPELGASTLNLAYLSGGQNQGFNQQDQLELGRQGNIIPDIAEIIIDIRPANQSLTAKQVVKLLRSELEKNGLKLIQTKIRHDLGAWITKKQDLLKVTRLVNNPKFINPNNRGYVDLQMLWQTFNQVACTTYGPGDPACPHQPNEYVPIKNINQASKFYKLLISSPDTI